MTDAKNIGGAIGVFADKTGDVLNFRTIQGGTNVSVNQCNDRLVINATGEIVLGINEGTAGASVFKRKVNNELHFRRLKAGSHVTLTETDDAIMISADSGSVLGGHNLGDLSEGAPVLHDIHDGYLRFKRLYAGTNVSIVDNGCSLIISAGPKDGNSGEVNLANNVGDGAGIYAGKIGPVLLYKSLIGVNGVQIRDLEDHIEIDATSAGGESNYGQNLGGGYGVYANKAGTTLQFRSIKAGQNVVITESANELLISAHAIGEANTASNIGHGAGVFAQKTDADLRFKSLVAGGNIKLDTTADTIMISAADTLKTIGTPSHGSFNDPRFPGTKPPAILGWNENTTIADALDQLNKMLGLLLPDRPPALSTKSLVMVNGGMSIVPAGVTDHCSAGYVAGQPIYRITDNPATTDMVVTFGSGNTGTLIALVNGQPAGSVILNNSNLVGVYGALEISADDVYPLDGPQGVWRSLNARIRTNVPKGINSFQLVHSETGSTNKVVFLLDEIVPTITVNSPTVLEGGVLEFVVEIDKSTAYTVTVDYTTADGTAVAGQDYTAANGKLIFAPNETSKVVQISTSVDLQVEGDETVRLLLSNATNAIIAGSGMGTITDAN